MADWETIKAEIQTSKEKFQAALDQFKADTEATEENLLKMVEAAKQDEIMKTLMTIVTRLDKIEKRLPEEEPDNTTTIKGR